MKSKHTLIILTLICTLTLVGCSSVKKNINEESSKPTQTASQAQVSSQATSIDIKTGVTNMIAVATDLKNEINTGDEAKIKVIEPQLVEQTDKGTETKKQAESSSTDKAGASSKEKGGKPSTAPAATPSTAKESDSTTNNQNAPSTNNAETTSKESSNIKPGVTKMLSIAADFKSQLNADEEAKVKASAPQLEETWVSFEEPVKAKYPDMYAKVEKYLFPTVAASKASPLDKQTLLKLVDLLTQSLNDLAEKVK